MARINPFSTNGLKVDVSQSNPQESYQNIAQCLQDFYSDRQILDLLYESRNVQVNSPQAVDFSRLGRGRTNLEPIQLLCDDRKSGVIAVGYYFQQGSMRPRPEVDYAASAAYAFDRRPGIEELTLFFNTFPPKKIGMPENALRRQIERDTFLSFSTGYRI
jgi:hypothetical protein